MINQAFAFSRFFVATTKKKHDLIFEVNARTKGNLYCKMFFHFTPYMRNLSCSGGEVVMSLFLSSFIWHKRQLCCVVAVYNVLLCVYQCTFLFATSLYGATRDISGRARRDDYYYSATTRGWISHGSLYSPFFRRVHHTRYINKTKLH